MQHICAKLVTLASQIVGHLSQHKAQSTVKLSLFANIAPLLACSSAGGTFYELGEREIERGEVGRGRA